MQTFEFSRGSLSLDADASRNLTRFSNLGEVQSIAGFCLQNTMNLNRDGMFNAKSAERNIYPDFFQNLNSPGIGFSVSKVSSMQIYPSPSGPSLPNDPLENWGDSRVASVSPRTDTSTDVETDDKNHLRGPNQAVATVDSSEKSKERIVDQKTLRRLAQNREAARKSRLRKKAYVQELENSRLKLTQLEQELQQTRQQGVFITGGCIGDQSHPASGNGALAFDMEYSQWLDEHQRQVNDLRVAVNSHICDNDLRLLVDAVMTHYDEIFRLKRVGAKADIFHMMSGMWKTPAERCFMWMGGFRPSELLKTLVRHLEPLTEQQYMGLCNLQQSSQQGEDALSQGMEALQQSLVESLSSSLVTPSGSSDITNYMAQMATAMGKLGTLEGFLHQADHLRQQTLQQLHRILTTRQSARALLSISEYFSRLRALSSLWLARPRE